MTLRVVGRQEHDAVYLIHTGDTEVTPGRRVPCGRVYNRPREEIHPETLLDSIVKFGGWIEFEGSDEEREAIEREVVARLGAS